MKSVFYKTTKHNFNVVNLNQHPQLLKDCKNNLMLVKINVELGGLGETKDLKYIMVTLLSLHIL